jgi:hypothetical protein
MQCVAVIIQLASRDHVCRFESESETEGKNTKCVGKKRFNGSVTHRLRKEHVLRSPSSHFGQGKILFALSIVPRACQLLVVFFVCLFFLREEESIQQE